MPRKPLERNDSLPYHVNARTNNREPFFIPLERVWLILGNECLFLNWAYEAEIHALVLMPNHFHMILTVPQHDLGIVMREFMRSVTKTMNRISNRTGHVFGGRYHPSLIKSSRYFGHAYKYVYRNPVKAKLCDAVEDYPFSTIQGLLGRSALPFPLHYTRTGMELALPAELTADQLSWLNKPFPNEAETLIKKRLRRSVFDTIIDRKTQKRHAVLDELL